MTVCPLSARHGFCSLSTIAVHIAAALGFTVLPGITRAPSDVRPPVAIEISARPLGAFDLRDPARRQFGSLEFRGGLVLSSPYRHFGGLSGIRVDAEQLGGAMTEKLAELFDEDGEKKGGGPRARKKARKSAKPRLHAVAR